MIDPILRRADVERVTGLRTSTLYEKVKRGEFPRPVKLNPRASGWLTSEVAEWQRGIIAARDGEAAA